MLAWYYNAAIHASSTIASIDIDKFASWLSGHRFCGDDIMTEP